MKSTPAFHPIKNKCLVYLMGFILCNLLVSCATLYVPNAINAPLLAEKGDAKIAIGSGENSSFELQGAYAFTDHFAMTLNASSSSSFLVANHVYGEIGAGYFSTFSKPGFHGKKGRLEILTGFGQGSSSQIFFPRSYNRLFVQPSVGMSSKIFDISFSARIAHVHFYGENENQDPALRNNPLVGPEWLKYEPFGFSTVEPVVTLSLGYKHFKPYLQVGKVIPIGGKEYFEGASNITTHLNAGLKVNLWRKEKDTQPPVAIAPEEVPPPLPPEPDMLPTEHPATKETEDAPTNTQMVRICLRDGGTPDGDVVSVSYRGEMVVENFALQKEAGCFDLPLLPSGPKRLLIHAISEGKVRPNTLIVSISDGEMEQVFNIETKLEKPGEIVFTIGED